MGEDGLFALLSSKEKSVNRPLVEQIGVGAISVLYEKRVRRAEGRLGFGEKGSAGKWRGKSSKTPERPHRDEKEQKIRNQKKKKRSFTR